MMFALLLALLVPTWALTTTQYQSIQASVRSIEPPSTDVVGQADYFGGLVRLAFHDSGTFVQQGNLYRACGWLNYSDPGNSGLSTFQNQLEPLYPPHMSYVSKADFWVAAAYTVIEDAGGPTIPFMGGRVDCTNATAYKPAGLLPNPEGNWTAVTDVFVTRMGLTETDIIALLGAHVLGRCKYQNTGYEGYWVGNPNRFTNGFYSLLLNTQWFFTTTMNGTHQWQTLINNNVNNEPSVMLNTDMAMRFGNVGVGASCNMTNNTATCADNTLTLSTITKYANNQSEFFTDFVTAYSKLTSRGYTNLAPLSAASTVTVSSVLIIALGALALMF